MNAEQLTASAIVDSPLPDLVDEITQRLNAGEQVRLDDYVSRYPELAETLGRLWEALTLVRQPEVTVRPDGEPELTPQRELGDFRILRELGRGGMGVVYEAEQLSIGRRVALKVLPFAAMLDKQQLNRFKNEARAAGTLDHPNIVQVFSVGVERGVHYYAMQLIEGESLAQVISRLRRERAGSGQSAVGSDSSSSALTADFSPKPPPDTAPVAALSTLHAPGPSALNSTHSALSSSEYFRTIACLGVQAAEALDHAHQNGILHRDVKPANLMIDGAGKLWITDFGLARIEQDAGMTMTGDLLGTLRYMSPEQALAKRVVVDHRSDVYSLGATFYELLTLQPVFQAEDRQELLRQIAFDEPRKPRQINSRIPQELETIALKAIEKCPTQRYGTSAELAADLRRYLDDKPINAKPLSRREQTVKWCRKHPAAVSAAAFSLAAAAILALTSTLLIAQAYRRESAQRLAAEKSQQQARADARRAEAISSFLVRAFESPNPARDGHSITVAEVLTRAEKEVDSELSDDPLTLAALLTAIAKSRLSLGLAEDAIIPLTRSREIREARLGPDHPDTVENLHLLANAYLNIDIAKTTQLLEEAIARQRQQQGDVHPKTLAMMQELAIRHASMGRTSEAVRLLQQVVDARTDSLGADHLDTVESRAYLSFAKTGYASPWAHYGNEDEYHKFAGGGFPPGDDTLSMLQRAVSAAQQQYGSGDANTLAFMHLLGVAYSRAGRFADAVRLHRQCLVDCQDNYGPDHPIVVREVWHRRSAMRAQILAFRHAGKLAEAENLVGKAIAECVAEGRYTLVVGFVNLATEEQFVDIVDSAISVDHRGLATGLDMLVVGELRLLAGRVDDALAAIQSAIERDRRDFCNKSLGLALLTRGNREEAKDAFQHYLNPQRRADGTLTVRTLKADEYVNDWTSAEERANGGPDQLTCAYFLDLVTQDQYVDALKGSRWGIIPWFFIGQRREIEGDRPGAVAAYQQAVDLGDDESTELYLASARFRLRKLTDTPEN